MKYKQEVVAADSEWTEWIFPIMDGYKMACCDCGLVHNLQFKVARIGRIKSNGTFVIVHSHKEKTLRVGMRVNRNNRATAAVRRERKKSDA